MAYRAKLLTTLLAAAVLVASAAGQSLSDVARQERAKKKPGGVKRVITDDELGAANRVARSGSTKVADGLEMPADSVKPALASKDEKLTGADLQAKIKTEKQKVRELEAKIQGIEKKLAARDTLGNVSVYEHVSGVDWWRPLGDCDISKATHANPYKEWCEEPAKLTAEMEKSQEELTKARSTLEALQEQARKMGYGSAFYDPD